MFIPSIKTAREKANAALLYVHRRLSRGEKGIPVKDARAAANEAAELLATANELYAHALISAGAPEGEVRSMARQITKIARL
jgi:hypothetical protein